MSAATVAAVLASAAARLQTASDTPLLDVQLLLAHCLGRDRGYLYTWPEQPVPAPELARFEQLLERRASGVPVAYLLGRQGFWDLELEVAPGVLVPRPETELLVELALERLSADAPARVLDLGTGSGAIALAVAAARPAAQVTAVERSAAALTLARRNACRLGLERVELLAGDWFQPLAGRRFELILANPPYIGPDEPELGRLGHEPRQALVADEAGLADLRRICAGAPNHLEPGGWLALEHGYRQGEAVRKLMQAAGLQAPVSHRDLQGHERVTTAQRPGSATDRSARP